MSKQINQYGLDGLKNNLNASYKIHIYRSAYQREKAREKDSDVLIGALAVVVGVASVVCYWLINGIFSIVSKKK